jgi:DNA-binding CsgD family transcriptional regulator
MSLGVTELSALSLLANGKSPEEIATTQGLSVSMVNHNLRLATTKLTARNRRHAVALAVSKGLIEVQR